MKYLIVTADDLGLTKSINDGIAQACKEGIVTAVSVIPAGEAIADAINVLKDLPVKDIGAHLSLSETKPVLAHSKFYKNHNEFFFSLFFNRVDLNRVYEELKAQLEILKKTGLNITHINSHEHVHIIPKILDIFIRLAKEYKIPAIRFPRFDRPPKNFSAKERYRSILLEYFSARAENRLSAAGLMYTDYFMGLLDAGRLDINRIKNIIGMLKDGTTELVTHPAFLSPEVLTRYSWHIGGETELYALTDRTIKNAVENNGVKLISYADFLKLK